MERVKIGFEIKNEYPSVDDVIKSLSFYQGKGLVVEVVQSSSEEYGIAVFDIELKQNTVYILVHNGTIVTFIKKEN